MNTTPETVELAKIAIGWTLNAICDDPRKYWLLGNGTESYARLTAAHAALHGMDVDVVRKSFVPNTKAYGRFLVERNEAERMAERGRKFSE